MTRPHPVSPPPAPPPGHRSWWQRLGRGALALGTVAAWLLAPAPALAQDDADDGGTFGSTFALNTVLVTTFEADQPFLEAEAERVRGLVSAALQDTYVVLGMADVPAFTDYTADVYLRSCPDGQYIGCVFVVGGRAQTDWTVGGRVTAVEGGYRADLSFIDVSDAKLLMEMDVVLDGSNDDLFQEGVLRAMESLVSGEVETLDIRGDPDAEAKAKSEEEAARRRAQQFAVDSVYEDPEEVDRGDVGSDADLGRDGRDAGKVTADDLLAMEERGGLTPWERAGLTKGQYRLYRNSGLKLRDFKARLQGRKGELLFRLSMQVGSGAWGQRHETWYVQDNTADPGNLRPRDILDQAVVQVQERALSFGGQFEFGVGILPWLEVSVFGGIRQAPYDYVFYRELQGTDPLRTEEAQAVRTYQVGGRVGVVPFPAYPVRPTLHLGASYWSGSLVTNLVELPAPHLITEQLQPNNTVYVHANPGAEVSLGKWVVLWTRFDLDIPVVGRTSQQINIGNGSLSGRPDGTGDTGIGLGASAGLLIRVRVGGLR